MVLKKKDTSELSIKKSKFHTLGGNIFGTNVELSRGISKLQKSVYPGDYIPNKLEVDGIESIFHLEWQGFDELQPDHGLFLILKILEDEEKNGTIPRSVENLQADVEAKLAASKWRKIERVIRSYEFNAGNKKVFLQALWVELFIEPLEPLWFAAMAQHAFYILEDEYAFGYMVALLDQKQSNEADFLRGRQSVESAKMGGTAKAKLLAPETAKRLLEMERLIKRGHTIARAAELACLNGFGSSKDANKRLWARHKKK